jgi:hypothetical protein
VSYRCDPLRFEMADSKAWQQVPEPKGKEISGHYESLALVTYVCARSTLDDHNDAIARRYFSGFAFSTDFEQRWRMKQEVGQYVEQYNALAENSLCRRAEEMYRARPGGPNRKFQIGF